MAANSSGKNISKESKNGVLGWILGGFVLVLGSFLAFCTYLFFASKKKRMRPATQEPESSKAPAGDGPLPAQRGDNQPMGPLNEDEL